jgi:NADH dehydrogenase
LLHLSGIGADAAARSPYVRSRGEGEVAVRQEFEQAVIFRPSVMVGPDDALLSGLAALIGRLPVLPLFGRGETRLQPVFVGDVAEAAARALTSGQPPAPLYELGGPDIVSYRQLIGLVARRSGCRPLLLPVPFPLWGGITMLAGLLPSPPLTEGQVALMKRDNVAAPALPGLAELGVAPTPLAAVLERGVDAG